jgi:hypothetical protein
VTQGFQERFTDIRRGGFSIRPRHTYNPNMLLWFSIKTTPQQAERLSGVVNKDEWKRNPLYRLL